MLAGVEEANQPYTVSATVVTFIHHCHIHEDISSCLQMGHSEKDKWKH